MSDKGHRQFFLICGLLVSIVGAVTFGLLPPLILEAAIDRLTGLRDIPGTLALLYFAALATAGVFDTAKEVMITKLGQRMTRTIRHRMCAKLTRLPASYFATHDPGSTTSRFVNDVDTLEVLFASGIISMAVDACKVISILAVIFVKSKGLGILMAAAVPLLLAMTHMFKKRMLRAQLDNRMAVGKVNQHIPETLRNIRMIQILHKEDYMQNRYDKAVQESYRAMEKSNFYDSIYSPIILMINASIVALLMIFSSMGGQFQEFFGMSVGAAVAVISYVNKVFDPLENIGMEIQNIQSALAGVQRIREFLDEPELPEGNSALTMAQLRESGCPAIELSDVYFTYGNDSPVLRDCSFTVMPGEYVTITGRTGAGKTTVFRLLLGLYTPQQGCVQIFGANASEIPDALKRRLLGYVEQTYHPVPGTILDQITLWDDSISRESAEAAAKTVGLHDSILALKCDYSTPFSKDLFSQGQLQLLGIARAIVTDPAILLLDEVTANLDSETESRVVQALQKATENRTVLSISHRLFRPTGGRRIDFDRVNLKRSGD